jgi:hypothetical protein
MVTHIQPFQGLSKCFQELWKRSISVTAGYTCGNDNLNCTQLLVGQTHQNNGFDCRSFFWIGIFDFRLKVLEKR